MYEARSVSYSVGKRRILNNVDFAAQPGALTVIVGPNGSGKTTLLKALTGEIAVEGTVSINGHSLADLKPFQVATLRAVLPQSSVLSFPFSVYEVVRLGLSGGLAGLSAEQSARLPEQALARVDLAGFGGRYYSELSGGEQQRVQLARVLCQVWTPVLDGAPRYLLLDEPISSLDIRHQLHIMDIARNYATSGGGVIAILHDLNIAAMYADAIAVMREGTIRAFGPCNDVLNDTVIADAFDCKLRTRTPPADDRPWVLPQSAR